MMEVDKDASEMPLRVSELHAFATRLTALDVRGPDAALIDHLAALEWVKRAVVAAEMVVASAFLDSRFTADAAAKKVKVDRAADLPAADPAKAAGHEIGLAKRESMWAGRTFAGTAHLVVHDMPNTLAGLQTGHLTERVVTELVKATTTLTAADRALVDARIAGHFTTGESDPALAQLARRYADDIDPENFARRRRLAPTARRVGLRPAPDGMTYLTALLPLPDAVAVYAALTRAAETARSSGNDRSAGQVMADTLVEWITGTRAAHHLNVTAGHLHYCDPDEPSDCDDSHTDAFGRTTNEPHTNETPIGEPATRRGATDGTAKHNAAGRPPTDCGHRGAADTRTTDTTTPADLGAGETPNTHSESDGAPARRERRARYKAGDIIPGYGVDAGVGADNHTPTGQPDDPVCPQSARPEPGQESAPSQSPDRAAFCRCTSTDGRTPTDRHPIELRLVITPDALFGDSTTPATLKGEALPAWAARAMIADPDTKVQIRRLFAHPSTGQLIAMESRSRLFRGGLRDLVISRDTECRTPKCGAPIRHIDHVDRHADGGATAYDDSAGTCAACNLVKEAGNFTTRPRPHPADMSSTALAPRAAGRGEQTPSASGAPDDRADLSQPPPPDIELTTPTGHTYTSEAPALAPDCRTRPVRSRRAGLATPAQERR